MKKSLIALAVLAASGAAMAQSSVQVYGLVDLVLHKDKGAAAALTSGGVNTSRWGLKGTEDLGGGLKANFLIEQGFKADTGVANDVKDRTGTAIGRGFDRQAYIGLAGGFGEVKLGKVWTAFDDIAGATDAVFNANVLGPLNLVFVSQGYQGNPGNTIYYATPSFGGFSGAFSYSLDEVKNVSNDIYDFHVKYEQGPVFVGFAWQNDKTNSTKYTRLNGSYDLGAVKLLASYGYVNPTGANNETKEWSIGADIPLGSNLIASVGYGSSKTDGEAKRSTVLSAGVAYLMSKRTMVYAGFADANSTAEANRGAPGSRFGVGLQHKF
ncbi:Outer membrane porin protein 32 [Tepidimonas sediminis]|uniref:Outer membrane porin protein 32 n=1 Tax=Tepidimonas sediminis TaxID=2588941 RepID=A0A554WLE2_9BURK|nr:porin [Tepidimonas sediminis]TSE24375.1 Outer membrane porin protein 32 [Tepidimonas sediminis]